jgi:hypothetical protein
MTEQDPAGAVPPAASPTGGAAAPPPAEPDTRVPGAPAPAEMVGLLVKAIGLLPDGERDQVYSWLVTRGLAGPQLSGRLPSRLREVSDQLLSLQTAGGPPGAQPLGQQVVPVRFAADQHAQLRSWCSEHGFSMATVIRGLVARFLEGQLPARN